MTIAQALLDEFRRESESTRKFLERIPADELEWRPHEKSMTVGQLGLHIAGAPGSIVGMAEQDEIEAPDFSGPFPQPETLKAILDAFDESASVVAERLPKIDDARMQGTWRAVHEGKEMMSLPRAGMLRVLLLNHTYHHRGQLAVYLRLLDVKVPSAYGPTADEEPAFAESK